MPVPEGLATTAATTTATTDKNETMDGGRVPDSVIVLLDEANRGSGAVSEFQTQM